MTTYSAALERAARGDFSLGTSNAASARFSEAIWNIDWSLHLPLALTEGVTVAYSSFERARPFLAANLAAIVEEDPASSPFLQKAPTDAKVRYLQRNADYFEFKDGERTAGFMLCTPIDWSSYYIRLTAILPEYHGKKFPQRFLPTLFEVLKAAGVERVETETSPSNLAVMHIMNRFRFNVTGTVLSERWGALVRFTKFLDEESERVFLDQFCTGIRYQARGNDNNREQKGEIS
jgi:ribosomal protein S18 acetylase RimI-like enzyme